MSWLLSCVDVYIVLMEYFVLPAGLLIARIVEYRDAQVMVFPQPESHASVPLLPCTRWRGGCSYLRDRDQKGMVVFGTMCTPD